VSLPVSNLLPGGYSRFLWAWLALAGTLFGGRLSLAGPATEAGITAARRVVKIYGAGGIRGLEAYQTGILVSPTGHIVTALSTVLDAEAIDCVLDDGRRYQARLLGADLRRELAVLAIDGENLPCYQLTTTAPRAVAGTRVLALSNLFGVAVGDERVSLQHGVIAACVPLRARRGAHEAAYRGDAYILDCTTNNPGSPGGCLVDWQGQFLGMLGKELRAEPSGIWLSYALPADEVAQGYEQILAGEPSRAPDQQNDGRGYDPRLLGLELVPDLLDQTPPFVEAVLSDSAAAAASLQADDLIVALGSRTVSSQRGLRQELARLLPGDSVQLSLIRNGEIIIRDLGPLPTPPATGSGGEVLP